VRVAATNIMPGRRVTANDIVYTFFLFDNDVHRDLFRDSDLDAAISQSLDEAAGTPQKATSKSFLDTIQKEKATVLDCDILKQVSCPICDERLNLNEGILRLPCKHVFHDKCLCPWLSDHNTCPICRSELPPEPDETEPRKPSNSEMAMAAAAARRSFTHVVHGDQLLLRPPTPVMEAAGIQALNARLGVPPPAPPSPTHGALNEVAHDSADDETPGGHELSAAPESPISPRAESTTNLEESESLLGLEVCPAEPPAVPSSSSSLLAASAAQPQSESLDDLINEVTAGMSSAPTIPLDPYSRPATSSRLARQASRGATPTARPATQGAGRTWIVTEGGGGSAGSLLEGAGAEGVPEGITA